MEYRIVYSTYFYCERIGNFNGMLDPRHISPIQALAGELALFAIMVGLTIVSLNLPLGVSAVVFVIVMVLISLASYLTTYYPRVSIEDQKKADFLRQYLKFVINDYEQTYNTDYNVRANVMIPYKALRIGLIRGTLPFVSYDTYLRMWSWEGGGEDKDIESHEGGQADETGLKWNLKSPPQGNCGRAFINHQVRTAARKRSDEKWEVGEELTEHQKQVTRQVNSVLSAPIRQSDGEEPVAVFNLDAAAWIDETNFRDNEVKQYVAEEYAEPIGRLL